MSGRWRKALNSQKLDPLITAVGLSLLVLSCTLVVSLFARSKHRSSEPQSAQKSFATPKEATDALIQAAASYDLPALEKILGPESEDLLSSEDPVRDKNNAAEFAAKAHQKSEV